MICPNCKGYVTEKSMIKTKVKKWGNVDIEYTAICPCCTKDLGIMFWGKLTLTEEMQKKADEMAQNAPKTFIPVESGEFSGPALDPFDAEPIFSGSIISDGELQEYGTDSYEEYKSDEAAYGLGYSQEDMSGHYCPHCGGKLPNKIELLPKSYDKF